MDRGSDWSSPRWVEPHAPAPIVLGEMAEVRRGWRQARRQRWVRRIWPACVLLLLLVIVTASIVLSIQLRF